MLTEEEDLIELWDKYKAELSEINDNITGIVGKLFEKCRFEIQTSALPCTGNKNDKIEDDNKNENMDNLLPVMKIIMIKLLIISQISLGYLVMVSI